MMFKQHFHGEPVQVHEINIVNIRDVLKVEFLKDFFYDSFYL